MRGDTLASRERLPAHPSSVPEARRLIREWLASTGHEDLADGAELAVSELVTNALVHAGTGVEISARFDLGFLRVEVADGSTHLPQPRHYLLTSGTGRGLRMLEHTVDRWGAHVQGVGKVVWFELSAGGNGHPAGMARPDVAPPPVDSVPIELLDAPRLLYAAWREHADALLREHLLVRLDDADPGQVLEDHAAASEALTLLGEQMPAPEFGEDPDAVMADAVGPGVTVERLALRVPVDSVRHFEILDAVLDDAVALAEQGLLLTPPTQPEVRQMRRWLCGEVRRQSAGGPATPWLSTGKLPPPWAGVLEWDPGVVDDSVSALVAADDSNRIVAVSASALDLLGYVNRGVLVGQRLLGLIPARYHQAHLAGFTLHLTTGRSTMLGVPVIVPMLLRDGSERLVELTITSHHLPHGRRVFVAEMVPVTD